MAVMLAWTALLADKSAVCAAAAWSTSTRVSANRPSTAACPPPTAARQRSTLCTAHAAPTHLIGDPVGGALGGGRAALGEEGSQRAR
eukprot:3860686-Rhodomonas_salina.1